MADSPLLDPLSFEQVHKRALTRFIEHLQKGDPGTEDGRIIVQEINDRLEKETKKLARMKEMYDAEIVRRLAHPGSIVP